MEKIKLFDHLRNRLEDEMKLINIVQRQQKIAAVLRAAVDQIEVLNTNQQKHITSTHDMKHVLEKNGLLELDENDCSFKEFEGLHNTFSIWQLADMQYFNHIFVDRHQFNHDCEISSSSSNDEHSSDSMQASSSSDFNFESQFHDAAFYNPYSGVFKYFDSIGEILVQDHFLDSNAANMQSLKSNMKST